MGRNPSTRATLLTSHPGTSGGPGRMATRLDLQRRGDKEEGLLNIVGALQRQAIAWMNLS